MNIDLRDSTTLLEAGKSIEEISISYSNYNMNNFKRYEIDLKNNALWINNDTKDRSSPLTFVKNIDCKNIDNFIDNSEKYGFALWKGYYEDERICDGTTWKIFIRFSDATSQFSTGTCEGRKKPENWTEMAVAFKELTGEDILG